MMTFAQILEKFRTNTAFGRRATLAVGIATTFSAMTPPCLAAVPNVSVPDPSAYDIEEIPNLGGSDTRAYAINNAGTAVGYSMPRDCCAHGFKYSPFAFLKEAPSYARGINAAGVIAGDIDASGGGGCYHASKLMPGATPDHIDYDQWTNACSNGISFNSAGQLLGQRYGKTAGEPRRAMKKVPGADWDELVLPEQPYGAHSEAGGMNDFGEVVGYRHPPFNASYDQWRPGRALYWYGGYHDLNSLTTSLPSSYVLRTANAINNHHVIVGFGSLDTSTTHTVGAYTLHPTGNATHPYQYVDLHTLPGGGISYALAINNSEDGVVGAAYQNASGVGNNTAVLFTHGRVVDLHGALKLTDRLSWTLAQATGINDHGQVVGWGTHGGATRAFILKPHAHIAVNPLGGAGQVLLVISGTGFYSTAPVTIEVREGDIGGVPNAPLQVIAANTQGAFTWNVYASCGKNLAVNAWDGKSGAFSNMVLVKVPCVH